MIIPANNYMFIVNKKTTTTRCGICSKLTITTSERRHCRHSGVFIDTLEHISHYSDAIITLCFYCYLLPGKCWLTYVWCPEGYSEPSQTSKLELLAIIVDAVNYFRKKLLLRCLTRFWIDPGIWNKTLWLTLSRKMTVVDVLKKEEHI